MRAMISVNSTVQRQLSTFADFVGSPSEYMISLERTSEAS
jgi:hypothetical protein